MSKKNLLVVGAIVIGLGIGIIIGLEQIQTTKISGAKGEENQTEKNENLGKDGTIQVVRKREGNVEEMIKAGKDLKKKEYLASDGEIYVFIYPPQLETKVSQAMDSFEQQIQRQKLVKEKLERTPEERAEVIKQIKDLFGESEVVYQGVSGDPYTRKNVKEEYKDGQGRVFDFDVDKNKILSLQVGGEEWCKTRRDILDENCHYKKGKIVEEQARKKVLMFLTKIVGEVRAKEIIENVEIQRATEKGNTFVFIYPAAGGKVPKDYQILVVVEPVKGEIVNYQNWLQ